MPEGEKEERVLPAPKVRVRLLQLQREATMTGDAAEKRNSPFLPASTPSSHQSDFGQTWNMTLARQGSLGPTVSSVIPAPRAELGKGD